MSLRYLLDTNIASCFLRRASRALEASMREAFEQESCAISVLTKAEIRFGQAGMAADRSPLRAGTGSAGGRLDVCIRTIASAWILMD